jgi:hypothetical protein
VLWRQQTREGVKQIIKQGRQCTYNVTLRHGRANILAAEKRYVWYILRVIPACNTHAPCCRLWPARLYEIFPHYLKNGTMFGEKMLFNKKCVFIFSETFVWNISHSEEIKNLYCSSRKVPVNLARF